MKSKKLSTKNSIQQPSKFRLWLFKLLFKKEYDKFSQIIMQKTIENKNLTIRINYLLERTK